jgi:RHS repeat-associated protein
MTSLSAPTVTAAFSYDAFGRRTTKTINGATTQYVYDGPNILGETHAAGSSWYVLGVGVDERFIRDGTEFFLADAQGSTVALADASGSVQTSYAYEPFGATTVTGVATTNPFQFTGRELDPTGLYYYRARTYDPMGSRFIQEDPVGFGGGDVNLYAYVRLQRSLDGFPHAYNLERPHQGYRLRGQTPASIFWGAVRARALHPLWRCGTGQNSRPPSPWCV